MTLIPMPDDEAKRRWRQLGQLPNVRDWDDPDLIETQHPSAVTCWMTYVLQAHGEGLCSVNLRLDRTKRGWEAVVASVHEHVAGGLTPSMVCAAMVDIQTAWNR